MRHGYLRYSPSVGFLSSRGSPSLVPFHERTSSQRTLARYSIRRFAKNYIFRHRAWKTITSNIRKFDFSRSKANEKYTQIGKLVPRFTFPCAPKGRSLHLSFQGNNKTLENHSAPNKGLRALFPNEAPEGSISRAVQEFHPAPLECSPPNSRPNSVVRLFISQFELSVPFPPLHRYVNGSTVYTFGCP